MGLYTFRKLQPIEDEPRPQDRPLSALERGEVY